MRLTELDPVFVRYDERTDGIYHVKVPTIAEAQGVQFLCPACFKTNNGPIGTHQVICWSRTRGVPEHARPGPGRWLLLGTDFADLTLDADPPGTARSVLLTGGCAWHGFVTNGEVA